MTQYSEWFKQLQDDIVETVESLDSPMEERVAATRQGWIQSHKTIKSTVFEKGTVNFSEVTGEFDAKFAKEIPGTEEHNGYYATGTSVILHPMNPWVPAMHFNTRYLKTSTKEWFGGGMDVTPCIADDAYKANYHTHLKAMCDEYDTTYYDKFSKACDEYFYLPHRKETRGIGGIFFEYHDPSTMHFDFVKAVGVHFNNLIKHTVNTYKDTKYSDDDRQQLYYKRGRYVEFNLLYDRGTRFGLKTGGDVEAILMSLPPKVEW
jgi:coproporphyrinogen III oxidase